MKPTLLLASVIMASSGLVACSPGIHGRIGYNIDFENGELVSHAPGHPNAYISASGDLRIGLRAVPTTPAQRALLETYYAQSRTTLSEGEATGAAAAKLGAHAVGDAIRSIFSSGSKQSNRDFSARANAVSAEMQQMCAGINQLHDTQQAIAAQLPAFKPYDAIGNTKCVITTTHSTTVTIGSGSSTTVSRSESAPITH